MKRKIVLVTGGLGFIGSNLVIHLIKLNYFVIILDKKTYSSNLMNLQNIDKKKYRLFISDINNKSQAFSVEEIITYIIDKTNYKNYLLSSLTNPEERLEKRGW